MTDEWVRWHRQYDEGDRLLAGRLAEVRRRIRQALRRAAPGPVRVVSLCAGDGRDLLGALERHPRARDVRARLIETSPELARAGRREVARRGLPHVEFAIRDASTTTACAGAVPAELVLLCGIFGNIRDRDVRNTIRQLPRLCAPGATVIWTRGRFPPDLTPTIRGWFAEAGFSEEAFVPIPGTTASVGTHLLRVRPLPFRSGIRLFRFLPPGQRPSARGRRPARPPRRRTSTDRAARRAPRVR